MRMKTFLRRRHRIGNGCWLDEGGREKEEVEEKDSRGLGCTPTVPHYMELK